MQYMICVVLYGSDRSLVVNRGQSFKNLQTYKLKKWKLLCILQAKYEKSTP